MVAGATVVVVAMPTTAEAGGGQDNENTCPSANVPTVFQLKARHVPCEDARALAERYLDKCYADNCKVGGFKCKHSVRRYGRYKAVCRGEDEKFVKFQYP